jgi:hypothetical protein
MEALYVNQLFQLTAVGLVCSCSYYFTLAVFAWNAK